MLTENKDPTISQKLKVKKDFYSLCCCNSKKKEIY